MFDRIIETINAAQAIAIKAGVDVRVSVISVVTSVVMSPCSWAFHRGSTPWSYLWRLLFQGVGLTTTKPRPFAMKRERMRLPMRGVTAFCCAS
ncbi:hypothetical protein Pan216_53000 [Planctomycetes bacterium Pan216]|uniref:Uncharacterized protein n=1 Tax=Kolteria novifilia TaxID=2527975 RepID=A0A518BBP9_9BACT|nr:hypothetical protein Pan216_53000 [Planctomycetes bacterium Pan216]